MTTLPFSSAAQRNQQPILDQLKILLPQQGTVLEIGSGTGQHAVFFSQNLPDLLWQPSDTGDNIPALEAQFNANGNPRILPLLKLNVVSDPWPGCSYEAIYSANTAHIMAWDVVVAMFAGVAAHLQSNGQFILYGPFNIDNQFTAKGNEEFDARLRSDDPSRGIRDMAAIEALAKLHLMPLQQKIPMPANNFILVFEKA